MLNIDQQISIQGRITEFQMEYIKSKILAATKEGSNLSARPPVQCNIQKLKEDEILYLKQKVTEMETLQIQTAHKYAQQINVLEALLTERQAQLHQINSQIMEMRAQITEFSEDLHTIDHFLTSRFSMVRLGSPSKKDKRNTVSSAFNHQKKVQISKDVEPAKEELQPRHRKTYSCGNLALTPHRISTKLSPKVIAKK